MISVKYNPKQQNLVLVFQNFLRSSNYYFFIVVGNSPDNKDNSPSVSRVNWEMFQNISKLKDFMVSFQILNRWSKSNDGFWRNKVTRIPSEEVLWVKQILRGLGKNSSGKSPSKFENKEKIKEIFERWNSREILYFMKDIIKLPEGREPYLKLTQAEKSTSVQSLQHCSSRRWVTTTAFRKPELFHRNRCLKRLWGKKSRKQ